MADDDEPEADPAAFDHLVLQVFEEQDERSGVLTYPLSSQAQARDFIKLLNRKGFPYKLICAAIDEKPERFRSWRLGNGNTQVGANMMRRINRTVQEAMMMPDADVDVNIDDLIDDDIVDSSHQNEEKSLAVTVEQNKCRLSFSSSTDIDSLLLEQDSAMSSSLDDEPVDHTVETDLLAEVSAGVDGVDEPALREFEGAPMSSSEISQSQIQQTIDTTDINNVTKCAQQRGTTDDVQVSSEQQQQPTDTHCPPATHIPLHTQGNGVCDITSDTSDAEKRRGSEVENEKTDCLLLLVDWMLPTPQTVSCESEVDNTDNLVLPQLCVGEEFQQQETLTVSDGSLTTLSMPTGNSALKESLQLPPHSPSGAPVSMDPPLHSADSTTGHQLGGSEESEENFSDPRLESNVPIPSPTPEPVSMSPPTIATAAAATSPTLTALTSAPVPLEPAPSAHTAVQAAAAAEVSVSAVKYEASKKQTDLLSRLALLKERAAQRQAAAAVGGGGTDKTIDQQANEQLTATGLTAELPTDEHTVGLLTTGQLTANATTARSQTDHTVSSPADKFNTEPSFPSFSSSSSNTCPSTQSVEPPTAVALTTDVVTCRTDKKLTIGRGQRQESAVEEGEKVVVVAAVVTESTSESAKAQCTDIVASCVTNATSPSVSSPAAAAVSTPAVSSPAAAAAAVSSSPASAAAAVSTPAAAADPRDSSSYCSTVQTNPLTVASAHQHKTLAAITDVTMVLNYDSMTSPSINLVSADTSAALADTGSVADLELEGHLDTVSAASSEQSACVNEMMFKCKSSDLVDPDFGHPAVGSNRSSSRSLELDCSQTTSQDYDSDLDPSETDSEHLATLLADLRHFKDCSTIDGPAYLYVFTNQSQDSLLLDKQRFKVATSRFPHKRLQQGKLFNPDLTSLNHVFVTSRRRAGELIGQRLAGLKVKGTYDWFSCSANVITDVINDVAKLVNSAKH